MDDILSLDDIAHLEVLENQVRKHDQQLQSIMERLQPLESIVMQFQVLNADLIQAGDCIRADMRAFFKQIFALVCERYNVELPSDVAVTKSSLTAFAPTDATDSLNTNRKSEASSYTTGVPTFHGVHQFQNETQSLLTWVPEVLQPRKATAVRFGQIHADKTVQKNKAGQTVHMVGIFPISKQFSTGEYGSVMEVPISAISGQSIGSLDHDLVEGMCDVPKVFDEMRPRVKMKILSQTDEIDKLIEVHLIVGNMELGDAVLDRTNLKVLWPANPEYVAADFVYDEVFKSLTLISFDCDLNLKLLLAEICAPTDKPPPLVMMHDWIVTQFHIDIKGDDIVFDESMFLGHRLKSSNGSLVLIRGMAGLMYIEEFEENISRRVGKLFMTVMSFDTVLFASSIVKKRRTLTISKSTYRYQSRLVFGFGTAGPPFFFTFYADENVSSSGMEIKSIMGSWVVDVEGGKMKEGLENLCLFIKTMTNNVRQLLVYKGDRIFEPNDHWAFFSNSMIAELLDILEIWWIFSLGHWFLFSATLDALEPSWIVILTWCSWLEVEIQFLESSRAAGYLSMGFSLANLEIGLHYVSFSSILGDKDVLHWGKNVKNNSDINEIVRFIGDASLTAHSCEEEDKSPYFFAN